ncbi:uncharacterized protein VTP21DRAFT_10785 [Calcarisporiella thermophila]|uniref:uncharacterized protein n=1 Tax=Calcarisporiella thermophila TaxID=911321 RepID=UPI00374395B3
MRAVFCAKESETCVGRRPKVLIFEALCRPWWTTLIFWLARLKKVELGKSPTDGVRGNLAEEERRARHGEIRCSNHLLMWRVNKLGNNKN